MEKKFSHLVEITSQKNEGNVTAICVGKNSKFIYETNLNMHQWKSFGFVSNNLKTSLSKVAYTSLYITNALYQKNKQRKTFK